MKALVLLSLLLVLLWLGSSWVRQRSLNPSHLRAVVALLVGFYLLTTALLGLFWMSRMELPVFDWHYLVGYCLLVVALWHLWLEWPRLSRFFKGVWEGALPRWFWLAAVAAGLVAFLVVFGGLWFLHSRQRFGQGTPAASQVPASPPTASPAVFLPPPPVPGWPSGGVSARADDGARRAVAYMSKESSASLGGLVRRGLFFGPKVASLRNVEGQALIPLPPPVPELGRGLSGALQWLASPTAPRCGAPSLAEVATLLFAATGVTEVRRFGLETVFLRAAPSAGALYPVEVYLVSTGQGDLAPRVYAYAPEKHALLPVPGSSDARAWARALGMSEGAVVSGPLVVFTAVFQRTVWKYGSRSYRYVALDAGHVGANFWLATSAASWPVEVTPFFADPEVEALLGLSMEEGAMAVAVFGRPPAGPRVVPAFFEVPLEGSWDREELTRLSHRLTRWQWTEGEPWVWQPRWVATAASQQGPDLLQLIRSRRSYRRFSHQPLSPGHLPTILARAGLLASLVPGGDGVEIRVVVMRDQGLAPGVYRWLPAEGRLKLVRAGNFGRALYRAGLSQELLERAAAAVVFSLNEEVLASAFGRRGFRVGLWTTGMLGEVVYLAAGEVGLKACGVGAFADDELFRLLELSEGYSPVYLVALGKE